MAQSHNMCQNLISPFCEMFRRAENQIKVPSNFNVFDSKASICMKFCHIIQIDHMYATNNLV